MARIEYWLQIENGPWDTAPNGVDRLSGATLARGADGMFKPLAGEALFIRRYTANWASGDDRPLNAWDLAEPDPAGGHGTIPGATIEAKVGDEIVVHFRNMDQRAGATEAQRTHSLQVRGLQAAAMYVGRFPYTPADPAQGNRRGDRVGPGESFDYRYTAPHQSNAGVWWYGDGGAGAAENVKLGSFGAVVVRGGGEGKANVPAQALRGAGDTPFRFANVPPPPSANDHLLVWHTLGDGVECLNGRQGGGNTPELIARANTRLKLRVLNLTQRARTITLDGHRWRHGDGWVDSELLGPGQGATIELLEGSAENGGGNGEWPIGCDGATIGSLVVTEGGPVVLS